MSNLTDREGGFVARRLRERVAGTAAQRMAAAEQRLAHLERALVRQRAFRGVRLEVPRTIIRPDRHGMLSFSGDGLVTIKRKPNLRGEHAKWEVDVEPGGGCEAAIITNVDCQGDALTATGCGAAVTHASGNGYINVRVTGTANAQTLNYHWCAPEDTPPLEAPPYTWPYGPPVTWLRLARGDSCLGGCVDYIVPVYARRLI